MLQQPRRKTARLEVSVELIEMDTDHLDSQNDTFDWAVTTFVFCSVPNAVDGLKELSRVIKPEAMSCCWSMSALTCP